MPDYRIFVLEGGRIKEPAKVISCPDDEAATEEARKLLLDGADHPLEVWQGGSPRYSYRTVQKQ